MSLKFFIGAGALIFLLAGLLAIAQTKLERVTVERDQAINYSTTKDDSLVQMRTKLGQVSTRSSVLELTIRSLERLQSDKDLQWLKQINGINKRMNNVEQIASTTAKVIGSFKTGLRDTTIVLPSQDSTLSPQIISAQAFSYKNEWYSIIGEVMPDTLNATLVVYVPLQSVVYWERRKFLGLKIGKKDWFKQTTSTNPYVSITEDKLIRVSKKPK